jgi:hypothetical protein
MRMRILGWVLLVGGFLLCVSVLWAAAGFLSMGLGLIFLQIAEQKTRRAKSAILCSERFEPQREPLPVQETTGVLVLPEEDERTGREDATGPHSYDKQRWRSLLSSDADISRLAAVLATYGQKYVDEFAAAYLAQNDKAYLPMILRNIIASARRDSGVAGDFSNEKSNADAVGTAFNRARRFDRVRESQSSYIDNPSSMENVPTVDPSAEIERVSEPSGPEFSGDVAENAARKTAIEETNLKPAVAPAERDQSSAPNCGGSDNAQTAGTTGCSSRPR